MVSCIVLAKERPRRRPNTAQTAASTVARAHKNHMEEISRFEIVCVPRRQDSGSHKVHPLSEKQPSTGGNQRTNNKFNFSPREGTLLKHMAKLWGEAPHHSPAPSQSVPFFLFRDRGGWVVLNPYRLYHKPPLRGFFLMVRGCAGFPRPFPRYSF